MYTSSDHEAARRAKLAAETGKPQPGGAQQQRRSTESGRMTDSPPTHRTPVEPPAEPPRFESQELFQGARVVIAHAGETYRLLLTRNNRLILQK